MILMVVAIGPSRAAFTRTPRRQMSGPGATACRAPPGKGQPWRSQEVFEGVYWHSCQQQTVLAARAERDKARSISKGRKTAVTWEGLLELPDGFYLPWRKPASWASGYGYFSRTLGTLVWERGQSSAWRVVGHPHGFDPLLVGSVAAAAVAEATGGAGNRRCRKRSRFASASTSPAEPTAGPAAGSAGLAAGVASARAAGPPEPAADATKACGSIGKDIAAPSAHARCCS